MSGSAISREYHYAAWLALGEVVGSFLGMLSLLIVLLVIAAIFGVFGYGQPWGGARSWSPLGIVLVILLVLALTGNLGSFDHGRFRL
jgi:hypothetical protein